MAYTFNIVGSWHTVSPNTTPDILIDNQNLFMLFDSGEKANFKYKFKGKHLLYFLGIICTPQQDVEPIYS